jgi:hypothetical protein
MTTRDPVLLQPASDPTRLILAVTGYALAPVAVLVCLEPAAISFWWDLAMTLGVVGAGGLALLPVLSARWWVGTCRNANLLRLVQRLHRDLAWWLGGFTLLHVSMVLWLEPRTLGYLWLSAPGYMLAGLLAVILILVLNLSSLARIKHRWSQVTWRRWHAGLSILALSGMVWHLLGAGYYFADLAGYATLLWLVGVPSACALRWHRAPPRARRLADPSPGAGLRPQTSAVLAVVLALLAAALWLAQPLRATSSSPPHYPCPAGRCL